MHVTSPAVIRFPAAAPLVIVEFPACSIHPDGETLTIALLDPVTLPLSEHFASRPVSLTLSSTTTFPPDHPVRIRFRVSDPVLQNPSSYALVFLNQNRQWEWVNDVLDVDISAGLVAATARHFCTFTLMIKASRNLSYFPFLEFGCDFGVRLANYMVQGGSSDSRESTRSSSVARVVPPAPVSIAPTTTAAPDPALAAGTGRPTLSGWCRINAPAPPTSRHGALALLEDRHLRKVLRSVVELSFSLHYEGRSFAMATTTALGVNTTTSRVFEDRTLSHLYPRVADLNPTDEIDAVKRVITCSLLGGVWDRATPLVPDLANRLIAGHRLEAADLLCSPFSNLDELYRHPLFWSPLQVKDLVMTFDEEVGELPRLTPNSPSTLRDYTEAIVSGLVGGSSLDWSCLSPVLLRHLGYVPPEGAELQAVLNSFTPRPEAPTERSPASKCFDGKFNCYLRHDGVRCPLQEHIEAFNAVFRPSPPIQHECTDGKCKSKCTDRSNCRTPPWSFPALAEQLRHALVHCTHWNSFAASDVADVKEVLGVPTTSPITDIAVVRWLVWPPAGSSLPAYIAGGQYLMLIVRILRAIKGQSLATYFKGSLSKLDES
jgi:hypothetical protein